MDINKSRMRIDSIDDQIVRLLNSRAAEVKNIGRIKAAVGLPTIDGDRESEIFRRIKAESLGQIDDDALTRIFEQIVVESRRMQPGPIEDAG